MKDLKMIPDFFRGPDGKIDIKKLLIEVAPYLLAAYVANKVSYGYHISEGADFWEKGMNLCNDFGKCFVWPPISIYKADLLAGLIAGGGLKLFVWYRKKNAKKFRKGQEFGSSRWGNSKDIRAFMDPVFERNILLTQTERLMLSGRPANPECARNKNVLVIGGSGSGKTRFFVKPNLMQMNCSFVVTDPKATILIECGKMLQRGTPKLDKKGNPVLDKNGKIIYQPYKISVIDTYVNSLSTASVAELYVTCGGVLLQMFSFKIMTALIFILSYGRIVEIFLMISVSPIAFATFGNKEWGQIGVNYLKGLLALAFQGYFIMVLVAIYVALLDGITHTSNVAAMVGNLLFVTLLFCFGFFKTASLSKQIFTVR